MDLLNKDYSQPIKSPWGMSILFMEKKIRFFEIVCGEYANKLIIREIILYHGQMICSIIFMVQSIF